MSPDYLLGQSEAYYQVAGVLAINLGFSITNLTHLYSGGDSQKTRAFLGISPGPVISGCELENLKNVARYLGKHLAYNAVVTNNILAAKIVHQNTVLSHPDNSDMTNYFLGLVNQHVLDLLENDDYVNFVK